MSDLTSESFWDKAWVNKKGSQSNSLIMTHWEAHQLLSKVIHSLSRDASCIELGCAPGSNMQLYHSINPGLTIDGIDISDVGLAVTREVMKTRKIKGSVHKQDIRQPDKELINKYNLVFSHGLIEHFDDCASMLQEHFKFAQDQGLILITVPNYSHPLIKKLLGFFSKKTIETHNLSIMNLKSLHDAAESPEIEVLEVGSYGGPLIPHCNPDSGLKGILYRFFARVWNLSFSLLSKLGLRNLMKKMWDLNFYILMRKKSP
jgi:2-polyprenyl-3-methyl-5-hydroxy-6-metoxy-1,4-benzoquinol methylase